MKNRNILLGVLVCVAGCGLNAEDKKLGKDDVASVRSIVQEELHKSIGYFDPFKVLEQSEEYKDEVKKIEKEIETRRKSIEDLEKKGRQKKQELDTMSHVLSESAKENKQEELTQIEATYRSKTKSAQEYAEGAEQKLRMRILKDIQQEAEVIAKEEDKLIVFAGGVVYGTKPIDLTDKIVKRVNSKYRAQHKKEEEKKSKPASAPAA